MKKPSLIDQFRETVDRFSLFSKTDPLLVAVSGGLDSTVLLHLVQSEGYSVDAVHCNFKLRGTESDRDEEFLRAIADHLSIQLHVEIFEIPSLADRGESIQQTARRIRYEYFKKIMDEYSYHYILTAHHLDDNLETSLINLIRGTGVAGLSGIPLARDNIVRPFLQSSRAEIRQYAAEHVLSWREDASNASDKYLRNGVRHQVVPSMQNLGMNARSLRKTFVRLRTERSLIDQALVSWVDHVTSVAADDLIVTRTLLPPDNELSRLVLMRIAKEYGFNEEQVRQMLVVRGKRTLRGKCGVVQVDPLVFSFGNSGSEMITVDEIVEALPHRYENDAFIVDLEIVSAPETFTGSALHVRFPGFPLHLRSRRKGDRFMPLGMGGASKKVKDLMKDEKVRLQERALLPLLCGPDGEIVALPGYRIAERNAVDCSEDQVLRIGLTKKNPGPT